MLEIVLGMWNMAQKIIIVLNQLIYLIKHINEVELKSSKSI